MPGSPRARPVLRRAEHFPKMSPMRNPEVPETLEGWSILHQMFRIRWGSWKSLTSARRRALAEEAAAVLADLETGPQGPSACVALLGHKADLMLIHFRRDFEALAAAELQVSGTGLADHLETTTSYLSMVELGLYEMTGKVHEDLAERGLARGTPEFSRAYDAEMAKQRDRMLGRLFLEVPQRRHVCFYPMDKRRV